MKPPSSSVKLYHHTLIFRFEWAAAFPCFSLPVQSAFHSRWTSRSFSFLHSEQYQPSFFACPPSSLLASGVAEVSLWSLLVAVVLVPSPTLPRPESHQQSTVGAATWARDVAASPFFVDPCSQRTRPHCSSPHFGLEVLPGSLGAALPPSSLGWLLSHRWVQSPSPCF